PPRRWMRPDRLAVGPIGRCDALDDRQADVAARHREPLESGRRRADAVRRERRSGGRAEPGGTTDRAAGQALAGGSAQLAPVSAPPTPVASPKPLPLGSHHLRLRKVATMEEPIALAVRPGVSALYVAEKTGRVFTLRDGQIGNTPVLDVSDRLSLGGEQGLLG